MANLLIMEPDESIARAMQIALTGAGHTCVSASTVADGLSHLNAGRRMMTILNARMPWSESIAFLRALEEKGLPVLFIVSDTGNEAHLRALYQSCCDVLHADYDMTTLIRAVDRLLEDSTRRLNFGALRMDVDHREVTLDGKRLNLTAQEFELLHALMASPDTAVSREDLLRTAWGYEAIGMTRTVDVHIQRLRRKLGPRTIETIYKTGYRLRLA